MLLSHGVATERFVANKVAERFIHYGQEPLTQIAEMGDADVRQNLLQGYKPVGLWFSVEGHGDGWKEFVEGSGYHARDRKFFRNATEIIFHPDAKILRLRTAKDLDKFTAKWRYLTRTLIGIDWPWVADSYDGIVIAPYCHARRFFAAGHLWYYPWDCSSGCVWRARAVESLRPAPEFRVAAKRASA